MKKWQSNTLVLALSLALTAGVALAQFTDSGQVNNEYDRAELAVNPWATAVVDYDLGWQDYQQTELGLVSYGSPDDVLGAAGSPFSLGDGGSITLTFGQQIVNGPGDDFAVFENGFAWEGVYMELGFVEVSSDGRVFSRLPALCRQDAQPGPWSTSDPALFYNLAGNYVGGTGFDLDDLLLAGDAAVAAGLVDLAHIRYVRVVDVVGDITGPGGTTDHLGRPVADPYPTPGTSSGMDLTGVAIIHMGAVETQDASWGLVKSLYR